MMNRKSLDTFVNLFHAVPAGAARAYGRDNGVLVSDLLNAGIVVLEVDGAVLTGGRVPSEMGNALLSQFGTEQKLWNQTFHKSWEKVRTAPIEQLVFEQLVHYFSTYGLEALGYDAMPLFPVERVLTDPATRPNIRAFTVIRIVPNDFAREMFMNYLGKTLAPHKNLVAGIIELMSFFKVNEVDKVASFELKVALCDLMDTVPVNPQDFLRYVVYKATGSTLLIKNKRTIEVLKARAATNTDSALRTLDYGELFRKADHEKLASIFYRFKPIFLAFKSCYGARSSINSIRRLAPRFHQPVSDVNVQNLINLMQSGRDDDVNTVLARCTGRQLIKLFNFCIAEMARTDNGGRAVYNIRNGKIFVGPELHKDSFDGADRVIMLARLGEQIGNALTYKFDGKLTGKKFFLPEYVHYAAPVSEKQFIGNIPYGTWVNMPDGEPVSIGVAWENYKGHRTDIDLHMTSPLRSFGWNSGWRAEDILYSGDMVDATHGAAEVYRFTPSKENKDEVFLLTVNNFTGEDHVPFKFLITEEDFDHTEYRRPTPPIDVDGAMFPAIPVEFDENNSMALGLVYGTGFFFYGGELGTSIVPKRELYKDFLMAMTNRIISMVQIRTLIENAGGQLVIDESYDAMTDEERAEVIDLSPAALTPRSLLDLVDCGD